MSRLAIAVTGAVLVSAAPAVAQQGPRCDGPQDACRQLTDLTAKYSAAWNSNDAAGLAALFTQDTVMVGEMPPLFGREAIGKATADLMKGGGWSNHSAEVEQTQVMGDLAWRFGTYSVTGPGPDKAPHKYHGYWSTVNQREGGAWKIRMETWNSIEAPAE